MGARARGRARGHERQRQAPLTPRVRVPVDAGLTGRLLRRYKRFLADVETDAGDTLTVHCPDPGSMRGLAEPGRRVRCSTSDDPRRKLAHTLEMIRVGRIWVGVNTARANRLVRRALEAGAIPPLGGYGRVRAEVPVAGGSRLDFLLEERPRDPRPCYVEVKSVTLCESGRGRFPDSVTERGRRHVETLARLHQGGARAVLLFLAQRADCDAVEPADDIDPAYGAALRRAAAAGVEVLAAGARVDGRGLALERMLPVKL